MIRPVTIVLLLACVLLLPFGAMAQCLEGNCVNGEGVKLTRGHKYSGSFKNNHRDGFGLYEYPNGDKYEGQFAQGVIQGHGVYYYAGGDRYEGDFEQGKRNGVGTYYPVEGRILRGVWTDGELTAPEQMVESEELMDAPAAEEGLAPFDDAPQSPEEPWNEEELNSTVEELLN